MVHVKRGSQVVIHQANEAHILCVPIEIGKKVGLTHRLCSRLVYEVYAVIHIGIVKLVIVTDADLPDLKRGSRQPKTIHGIGYKSDPVHEGYVVTFGRNVILIRNRYLRRSGSEGDAHGRCPQRYTLSSDKSHIRSRDYALRIISFSNVNSHLSNERLVDRDSKRDSLY